MSSLSDPPQPASSHGDQTPLDSEGDEPASPRESVELAADALFLGSPLDIARLRKSEFVGEEPLVQRVAQGHAVLFRWGVVVFIGVNLESQDAYIESLQEYLAVPSPKHLRASSEQATLKISIEQRERAFDGTIWLQNLSVPRMQIVAHALAASALLTHYERETARSFDLVEPLAATLREHGSIRRGRKRLVQDIGSVLEIRLLAVGRAAVREKPDVLWDHPELERIYTRLDDEFDLQERADGLEAKLSLLNDTSSVALGLLQNDRSHVLEWSIVILIVLELFVGLIELAQRF